MVEQASVEHLVSVVPAPDAGNDVFTNEITPWIPGKGVRGIFGGFLIAQAVRAAQLSSPPDRAVHALQSVFLKPGQATSPILYHVERIADGRTFTTRVVRAMQDGAVIYLATVGLQQPGPSRDLRHAIPPPDMDGKRPEDISETTRHQLLAMLGFDVALHETAQLDPYDWRHLIDPVVDDAGAHHPTAPHRFRLRSYVRSRPLSPAASPAVHLASLAFLTDEWLIAVVNLAHPGLIHPAAAAAAPVVDVAALSPEAMNTVRAPRVAVQASMNHNVLFHDPAARADEWLVSERSSSWARDGRVLIEQRLWSLRTGDLVLSCWQEGLVRLRDDSKI